jgi:hypothetical protein
VCERALFLGLFPVPNPRRIEFLAPTLVSFPSPLVLAAAASFERVPISPPLFGGPFRPLFGLCMTSPVPPHHHGQQQHPPGQHLLDQQQQQPSAAGQSNFFHGLYNTGKYGAIEAWRVADGPVLKAVPIFFRSRFLVPVVFNLVAATAAAAAATAAAAAATATATATATAATAATAAAATAATAAAAATVCARIRSQQREPAAGCVADKQYHFPLRC